MVRVYTPAAQGVYVRQLAQGGALLSGFTLSIAESLPDPKAETPSEA